MVLRFFPVYFGVHGEPRAPRAVPPPERRVVRRLARSLRKELGLKNYICFFREPEESRQEGQEQEEGQGQRHMPRVTARTRTRARAR